jgi:hypothetical protein
VDGVIYHGGRLLPGAKEFVQWLQESDKKFLFLTNSSERSPRELKDKLARMGIEACVFGNRKLSSVFIYCLICDFRHNSIRIVNMYVAYILTLFHQIT